MMAWPYHFLDLSPEEKAQRSQLLDQYGAIAQLSALVPILAIVLYRLVFGLYASRSEPEQDYSAVPNSPALKRRRNSQVGSLSAKWRSTVWWLQDEISPGWGVRSRWIAGGGWTLWLLLLCVLETGAGKCRRESLT